MQLQRIIVFIVLALLSLGGSIWLVFTLTSDKTTAKPSPKSSSISPPVAKKADTSRQSRSSLGGGSYGSSGGGGHVSGGGSSSGTGRVYQRQEINHTSGTGKGNKGSTEVSNNGNKSENHTKNKSQSNSENGQESLVKLSESSLVSGTEGRVARNSDIQGAEEVSDLIYFGMDEVAVNDKNHSATKRSDESPQGLSNLGNTCFMNSSLQSLTSIPSLVNLIRDRDFSSKPVHNAFKKLLLNIEAGRPADPKELFDALTRRQSILGEYQQQDSHEFLTWLFNAFNEEDQGLMSSLFQFNYVTSRKCSLCATPSTKIDQAYDLSLSIVDRRDHGKSAVQTSLEDCLNKWREFGEVESNCVSCGGITKASLLEKIQNPPQILAIHLKRYVYEAGSSRKISMHVTLNEHLYIEEARYTLRSFAVHQGSTLKGGHYIAITNRKGKWYEMSDSHVLNISKEAALRRGDAYMAFYERDNSNANVDA